MMMLIRTYLLALLLAALVSINSTSPGVVQEPISPILSTGNTILHVGGNGPGNYSAVQDAVDDAMKGDTVFVYDDSSPYNEHVVLIKSITLKGEHRDTTIINAEANNAVITIVADNVTLTNFTLHTSGPKVKGIQVNSSADVTIVHNTISNAYDGISLRYVRDTTIVDNTIHHCQRSGIGGYTVNTTTIRGNNISYNGLFGIIANRMNGSVIEHNTITDNYWDGIVLQYCVHTMIRGNTLEGSLYYGINLQSTHNYDNTIYFNNFLNNGDHARGENKNAWDNGWKGNYWDDYGEKYPDACKKIFGTWAIPYEISGGTNKDTCPLISPYTQKHSWVLEPPICFLQQLQMRFLKRESFFSRS